MVNSFGARSTLTVDGRTFAIFRLDALEKHGIQVQRLPFSLRILLENLLRHEDGRTVTAEDIRALGAWDPGAEPDREIAFMPSRVVLQDFTGVPAVVDLASMRDAMVKLGGDPSKINPLQPVDLVIDHSVQVDAAGTADALEQNAALEFQRNQERYAFLRWGQSAFRNFRLVPPATGIVHQVNLEYLARVVFTTDDNPVAPRGEHPVAYPDTVIGTDSHTTMINGLGVLGWGVGGIEAEAAMLGQPLSMLIPQVVGFRLTGKLPAGATATDLVLTVTQMLRKRGVVGKFVEFFGPGALGISLADRATIANMAPEYGATCGLFPVDPTTLRFLELTGRDPALVRLIEAYFREQHLFGEEAFAQVAYTDVLELDLASVEPSLAGPKRPQDRLRLQDAKAEWQRSLAAISSASASKKSLPQSTGGYRPAAELGFDPATMKHGDVVIAAITSCTNTSNPSVLLAAGLVAKKAAARGVFSKPWVKTSLAPGSRSVPDYLRAAGLLDALEQQRFHVVGYGCTTCIGNSGPLAPEVSAAIASKDLVVTSVLSGNRNFEGRVHPEVKANYLASPPLVVAYALAGTMDIDFEREPLGVGSDGAPVFLRDLWPSPQEIAELEAKAVTRALYEQAYRDVFSGDARWQGIAAAEGATFRWDDASTYVKRAPYFDGMGRTPPGFFDIRGARVLAVLGDSITTDHISPAGNIKAQSPAGRYLQERGVAPEDFNQYGARRGNHEVMVRGTFANIRLRNRLTPAVEGGVTRFLPGDEVLSIFDAADRYQAASIPTIILAGKEYGSGSSRDWAAKGPMLQGVKAVIAESFERIHRSNLVGMGVIPLQFRQGESAEALGLDGEEVFEILGLARALAGGFAEGREVTVQATRPDGSVRSFQALVRVDTPQEIRYIEHGGILHYVLRQLAFG
ncbi:MAG: aconitate hydratase AcnA [Polyangiaceae bacterium]|jgi:aconitate hydratase|nr:aconitate hydratase AcnA [Polyangiaceae bacterium]